MTRTLALPLFAAVLALGGAIGASGPAEAGGWRDRGGYDAPYPYAVPRPHVRPHHGYMPPPRGPYIDRRYGHGPGRHWRRWWGMPHPRHYPPA